MADFGTDALHEDRFRIALHSLMQFADEQPQDCKLYFNSKAGEAEIEAFNRIAGSLNLRKDGHVFLHQEKYSGSKRLAINLDDFLVLTAMFTASAQHGALPNDVRSLWVNIVEQVQKAPSDIGVKLSVPLYAGSFLGPDKSGSDVQAIDAWLNERFPNRKPSSVMAVVNERTDKMQAEFSLNFAEYRALQKFRLDALEPAVEKDVAQLIVKQNGIFNILDTYDVDKLRDGLPPIPAGKLRMDVDIPIDVVPFSRPPRWNLKMLRPIDKSQGDEPGGVGGPPTPSEPPERRRG